MAFLTKTANMHLKRVCSVSVSCLPLGLGFDGPGLGRAISLLSPPMPMWVSSPNTLGTVSEHISGAPRPSGVDVQNEPSQ